MRNRFFVLVVAAVVLAACSFGATPEPPLPTNTPVPTFTPTVEVVIAPVDPGAAATARAAEDAAAAATQAAANPQAAATDTPVPAEPTATDTPAPAEAAVTVNSAMNIRGGPGTNYNVIGSANAGQRFTVTGKNPAGDWWQINFNGQAGWVFAQLVTGENTGGVQVAANIPAAPVVPPTNTPVPAPTSPPAQPQPTSPPASTYKFNIAVVGTCNPNGGVTYVQGTTYVNGTPQSGDWSVAFSYAPDGPVVASVKAGPHPGYEGWGQGFYSHILKSDGPREGNWFFWVVDPNGNRISEIGNVHTDGEAGSGKCQQGVVDFDSR